jgi:hypothetical protein
MMGVKCEIVVLGRNKSCSNEGHGVWYDVCLPFHMYRRVDADV